VTQVICTGRFPRSGGPSCGGGPEPRWRQRSRLWSAMAQTTETTGAATTVKTVTDSLMSAIVLDAATPISRAGTKIANSSSATVITAQITRMDLTGDRSSGAGAAWGSGTVVVSAIAARSAPSLPAAPVSATVRVPSM